MHRAEEDYIKVIYESTVQKTKPMVKSNELATHFGYTDQSVNEMIKKLVSKKLVSFVPYHGISLTKKGQREAIRMIRSHRLWEVFLTEKLGMAWEEVHEDAERLEHNSTNELLDRLDQFLGYPKYCQHGNPIPDKDGHMAIFSTDSIDHFNEGESFQLTRVIDEKELLVFLNENHIQLKQVFTIKRKDLYNHLIWITHEDREITLSLKTAKMMFGHLIDN